MILAWRRRRARRGSADAHAPPATDVRLGSSPSRASASPSAPPSAVYQGVPYLQVAQRTRHAPRAPSRKCKKYSAGPVAFLAAPAQNPVWGGATRLAAPASAQRRRERLLPGRRDPRARPPRSASRARLSVHTRPADRSRRRCARVCRARARLRAGWRRLPLPAPLRLRARLDRGARARAHLHHGHPLSRPARRRRGPGARRPGLLAPAPSPAPGSRPRAPLPLLAGLLLGAACCSPRSSFEGARNLPEHVVPQPARAEIGLPGPLLDLPTDSPADRLWQYFSTDGFYEITGR